MTKESHPVHRQSAKSALLGAGYGLGWASFAAQLLVGFLGAPPLRYSKAEALQLGVTQAYVQKFMDWEENLLKMSEIPHTCTERELLIHCVAAKKIIDIYRQTAHQVVSFWEMLSGLIQTSLFGGKEFTYKCLTFRKEEIELPNGMKLLYPDLRQQQKVEGKKGELEWVYGVDATKLYAGKIANNVTQATARIVMTDGMLRVSKKYFVAGTVHDELIAVVPDEEVDFAKTWVLAQMTMEPKYMPGIPLAADGGAHRRYGLAKG
jgi:DNA polymerase